ncbi:hypothetical protein ACTMU2_30735 [Cupriavidus basilensis]
MIGPNSLPTVCVPLRWMIKSAPRITSVMWDDKVREPWRGDLQPFHGRQDGNSRRDDRIAIEHASAEDAKHHQQLGHARARGRRAQRQRHQGQHSPFAIVVRSLTNMTYLSETTMIISPEQHRNDAEHGVGTEWNTVFLAEASP